LDLFGLRKSAYLVGEACKPLSSKPPVYKLVHHPTYAGLHYRVLGNSKNVGRLSVLVVQELKSPRQQTRPTSWNFVVR
ncbi:MAG: hypothetical protein ACXWWP_02910, partial [Candidatus Binatia bacterium]